jgi:hypothetical protein
VPIQDSAQLIRVSSKFETSALFSQPQAALSAPQQLKPSGCTPKGLVCLTLPPLPEMMGSDGSSGAAAACDGTAHQRPLRSHCSDSNPSDAASPLTPIVMKRCFLPIEQVHYSLIDPGRLQHPSPPSIVTPMVRCQLCRNNIPSPS